MPRQQQGRGGGTMRGRGKHANAKSRRGGGGGGGGGAQSGAGAGAGTDKTLPTTAVKMRGKNVGLNDESKTLILELLHTLRIQEKDGAAAATQEEGGGASCRPANRRGSLSIEEMERALLMDGEGEEGEEEDNGSDGEEEEEVEEEEDSDEDAQGNELGKDRSFAKMANLLARAKRNGGGSDSDSSSSSSGGGISDDDDDEEEEGGAGASQLSKRGQELLLKSLIKEEREKYITEQQDHAKAMAEEKKTATLKALAKAEKAQAKGKTQPKGAIKKKVRVTLCSANMKMRKLVVIDRKKDLEGLFHVAKSKLKIKKPRKAVTSTGEVLTDTLLLEDDAIVMVLDKKDEDAEKGNNGKKAKGEEKEEEKEAPRQPSTTTTREAELAAAASLDAVKEAYHRRNRNDDGTTNTHKKNNNGQEQDPAALAAESARMLQEMHKKEASPQYLKTMFLERSKLPADSLKEAIVEAVKENQVVLVEGETGSGKTTQVPQFILDAWIAEGRGAECNIICTQPRRISAIGVAERVAAERMEGVGKSVGYSIRLETRRSARTRLLFVTTGILLRRLASDPELSGVTHVVCDEIHERDLHSDFLLIILKDLLLRRPSLKVVLMSATVEASLFSDYFGGCPSLHIPGRTFPVKEKYLTEVCDILRTAGVVVPGKVGGGGGGGKKRGGGMGRGGRGGRGRGGERKVREEEEDDDDDDDDDGEGRGGDAALDEIFGKDKGGKSMKALASLPADNTPIDYDLIVRLTSFLVEGEKKSKAGTKVELGAILIFLPGFAEIDRCISQMKRDVVLGNGSNARLFALHSSVPTEQQRHVFKPLPEGVCKVCVSTNIAETSITIPEVVHVICAGREKQMGYDVATHMTSLREVWISHASAKQRAGRAGRVRPGFCYRLYEEAFMQESMRPQTLPEIRRVTLEDLILTVLLLELGPPEAFLQKALQPPSSKAVHASLKVLLDIEAIQKRTTDGEILLKPLGFHLASLPLDCRLGKMLIIASIFDCLDPILTIVAAFSGKSPFVAPLGLREEAWRAKQRFAESKSDHLALVALWKAWSQVKEGTWAVKKDFCKENFVSMSAMENMEAVRKQLYDNLVECGFAPPRPGRGSRGGGGGGEALPPQATDYQANEYDERLLKCILVCGLTPQIAKLVRPVRGMGAHFIARDASIKLAVHPSSINARRIQQAGPEGGGALCVYHRKVETSRVYLHDISFVSPLSLLLFGSNVSVRREHGGVASKVCNICVDRWLTFKTKEESSVLLKLFKKQIDECLLLKVQDPDAELVKNLMPLVSTLRKLLQLEGGK